MTDDMDERAVELAEIRRLARTGEARTIRKQAQLSIPEVADVLGVTSTTVSRWELGRRKATGKAALDWLQLLSVLKDKVIER